MMEEVLAGPEAQRLDQHFKPQADACALKQLGARAGMSRAALIVADEAHSPPLSPLLRLPLALDPRQPRRGDEAARGAARARRGKLAAVVARARSQTPERHQTGAGGV